MKRLINLTTLCVLIFALALVSAHAKSKGDAAVGEAVKKLERGWAEAYVKGDAAALERIEAKDFTFIDSSGKISTKADDLRDVKSGALKMTECKLDDLKVRIYGKTAVVTGVTTVKGSSNGQDISGRYRFTDVLVRKKNEWKAVSTQESLIADKK
ncbi:MAG: nuclear transport factor 2 family protein [Verrucomicrobia bacterium]|nr:nuclear transport factor 2 family protein [Verrucomicrobiota bacterium]